MTPLQGLFAAISAVVLFLYGLQGFSRELQAVGGATLQSWLGRVTANRWLGFLVGALATAGRTDGQSWYRCGLGASHL